MREGYYMSVCALEFKWKSVPQNHLEITRANLFEQPAHVLQRVAAALGSDANTGSAHTKGYTKLSMALSAKDMKLLVRYAMCGGTGDGFKVDVRLVQHKGGGWVKLLAALEVRAAPWVYRMMDEICANWRPEEESGPSFWTLCVQATRTLPFSSR
jgi:hypothetical protein